MRPTLNCGSGVRLAAFVLVLGGCADTNIGVWDGETFDCADPAMNQRTLVAELVVEPLNGVGSHTFELDQALLAVGDDCNLLHSAGLGLEASDPVRAIRQWRCEEGVLDLWLDSTGTGHQRLATLLTQRRKGTQREPMEFLCRADLYRR